MFVSLIAQISKCYSEYGALMGYNYHILLSSSTCICSYYHKGLYAQKTVEKVSLKSWTKTASQRKVLFTSIYIDLIIQCHLFCSYSAYEYTLVSDIILKSEVAKRKLHSIPRLEVSQLSKPRVSDSGTRLCLASAAEQASLSHNPSQTPATRDVA